MIYQSLPKSSQVIRDWINRNLRRGKPLITVWSYHLFRLIVWGLKQEKRKWTFLFQRASLGRHKSLQLCQKILQRPCDVHLPISRKIGDLCSNLLTKSVKATIRRNSRKFVPFFKVLSTWKWWMVCWKTSLICKGLSRVLSLARCLRLPTRPWGT